MVKFGLLAMALGDGIFWMVSLEKATKQIYTVGKRDNL